MPEYDALARAAHDDVADTVDSMLLRWVDWLTGGPTGLPDPIWEANRRAALAQLRAQLVVDVRAPRAAVAGGVRDGLNATAGITAGATDASPAVATIASETVQRLDGMWPTVIHGLDQNGARALSDVLRGVRDGDLTRVQATHEAVDRMARTGVTGFVDKAGRRWEASSYAEMSVRTGVTDAHTAGTVAGAQRRGTDLVMVSDAPRECERCRPWEGKLLSIGGLALGTTPVDADGTPAVVAGTLDEAKAAGFMHSNCRHRTYAFVPGQTLLRKGVPDRAAYEASQRQRGLERRLRAAQTRAQALSRADPRSPLAVAARARATDLRRQIKQLVDDNPTLQRRTDRERAMTADPNRARRRTDRTSTLAAELSVRAAPGG
ncbi:MAG: phage minor capsid protein [Marmoricola sp.]